MDLTKTLRERAIDYRLSLLETELRRVGRARSNELASAEEQEEWTRESIAVLRREIATLRAMPVDVSDQAVRVAMGVA